MDEFPGLTEGPILESWKQPFYLASRQVPDAFFIDRDREGGRVVVLELCRTSDLEPGYWKEHRALKERSTPASSYLR